MTDPAPSGAVGVALTVMTATRNRAHLLPRLHRSLAAQGDLDGVVWHVIDDGSTDGTSALLDRLATEGPVPMQVQRIAPGGKHRALNAGLRAARDSWIVLIDSDDWLLRDGLATARAEIARAEALSASALMLPVLVQRRCMQHVFRAPDRVITFTQLQCQEPAFDSTKILHRTAFGSGFPEYEGESFLAETALFLDWPEMQILISNTPIAVVEYQPDGLSSRMRALRVAAPRGAAELYRGLCHIDPRLRPHLNFGRFWWHCLAALKRPPIPRTARQLLALGPGIIFAATDRIILAVGAIRNPEKR